MVQVSTKNTPRKALLEREKSRVRGAVGLDFASHWLKNWHESFKPRVAIAIT